MGNGGGGNMGVFKKCKCPQGAGTKNFSFKKFINCKCSNTKKVEGWGVGVSNLANLKWVPKNV